MLNDAVVKLAKAVLPLLLTLMEKLDAPILYTHAILPVITAPLPE